MKQVIVLLALFFLVEATFCQVSATSLTAHDHTIIMKAIIGNRTFLTKELHLQKLRHPNLFKPTFTLAELFAALLKAPKVDKATRLRMHTIEILHPKSMRSKFQLPDTVASQIYYIAASLSKYKTLASKIEWLTKMKTKYIRTKPQLCVGMDVAISMINDGKGVIYDDNGGPQDAGPGDPSDNNDEEPPVDPDSPAGGISGLGHFVGADVLGALAGAVNASLDGEDPLEGAVMDGVLESARAVLE